MWNKIMLLAVFVPVLAGCAVNSAYVSYTAERFPPKARYYFISIYPESQVPSFTQPYTVIGRANVSGRASEGVSADTLADELRGIARARGADAVINARTEAVNVSGVSVIPGYCGRRHCRPDEYVPYYDTVLSSRGELIVFTPAPAPDQK